MGICTSIPSLNFMGREGKHGMTVDYRYYKKRIVELCRHLNQTFLMPQFSPFLEYAEDEEYYYFTFNHKKIPFLKEDVTMMPLSNITVEELSRWFVHELIKDALNWISFRWITYW